MTYRNIFAALVLMLAACGGSVKSSADGSGGATGGGASGAGGAGASAGNGGAATYGGSPGTGGATAGTAGAGGATITAGAGGSPPVDASTSVVCTDNTGAHLSGVARACRVDADCTVLYGNTCCSASAYGIAKKAVAVFGGCFWTDLTTCAVDCAFRNSYRTDTGLVTPVVSPGADLTRYVAVHCTAGLCTTDALPQEAGADADAAIRQCGSGVCRAAMMSFCEEPNAYAMPNWDCTMDNGFQGYCCLPRSDCGASAYCASAGDCRAPMLLTQRGCNFDGGLGSCCVEPK